GQISIGGRGIAQLRSSRPGAAAVMLQPRVVEGSGHVGGVLGWIGVEGRSAAWAAVPEALPVVVAEEALFLGVLLVDRIADHDGARGHVVVASFDEKVIAMSEIGGGVLCADHAAAAGTIADRFLGGGCLRCGGSAAAAGGCLVFVAHSR